MQPERSTTLGSFNLMFGLHFFDNMFRSCWPLCPQICKRLQEYFKYTCQKGWGHLDYNLNATWAFQYPRIILFNVWVVFFDNMFGSWWPLCPQRCKLVQTCCKYTCQKRWGNLGCNLNVTRVFCNPIIVKKSFGYFLWCTYWFTICYILCNCSFLPT